MKNTYDHTAKAEALSRLIGAIRQEAEEITALQTAFASYGAWSIPSYWQAHKAALKAEIECLEIIAAEWREKAEARAVLVKAVEAYRTAHGVETEVREHLEKIPPHEKTAEGGQSESGPNQSTPKPFFASGCGRFAEGIVARERKNQES